MYNEDYKRVLEEKGRLWIGKVQISEQFLEENMGKIMQIANIALHSVKNRYGIKQNSEDEDLVQDVVGAVKVLLPTVILLPTLAAFDNITAGLAYQT